VLDGGNVVLELRDNVLHAKYTRAMNLVSSTIGGTTYYYLYNVHGDVVQLTNSSGTVTKTYNYDAFGVEKNPDNNDANPFRYCGEYFDVETGTYYLRARYYNPTVGRFLAEYPIRDGLNYYTYCNGDPIQYIDPEGMEAYNRAEYAHYKEKWTKKTGRDILVYATNAYYRSDDYAKAHGFKQGVPDESDAFRHFTWMLELTRGYGKEKALYVGNYHEKIGSPDKHVNVSDDAKLTMYINQATLMDFQNNSVGIALAIEDGRNYTDAYYLFRDNMDKMILDVNKAYAFFGIDDNTYVVADGWKIKIEFDLNSNSMKVFEKNDSGKYMTITFGVK